MSEVKILQLVPTPDVALWSILEATTVGNGASKIGVEDSADYYAGDDVESILQEIGLKRNMKSIQYKTIDYTIQTLDENIYMDGSNLTITLPQSTGSGRSYLIKNVNSTPLTITPYGTNTVDGATSETLYENESITICDYKVGKWGIQ